MSNPRKSIIPLDPVDIGGINPRADELVTTEVLGSLNAININDRLCGDDDILRDEYTKFLNEISNSPIIITNEDIEIGDSDSYFDSIDFNPTITLEDADLVINKGFFINNVLWANGTFGLTTFPIIQNPVTMFSEVTSSKRIMDMDMDFIKVQHVYRPQQLASMNDLVK